MAFRKNLNDRAWEWLDRYGRWVERFEQRVERFEQRIEALAECNKTWKSAFKTSWKFNLGFILGGFFIIALQEIVRWNG